MRFYVDIFLKNDESLDGYIETDLTPEQVSKAYGEHPVGVFCLTAEMANHFGLKNLNFETKDYFVTAAREYIDETYEYQGEKLYPPPLFLPDNFNTDPVRPGKHGS